MVWGEHGSQILGQFIGEDNLKMVILLKYDAIDEDNLTDERDATHPARGICFNFSREEMGTRIDRGRERIVFADEFLKSGEDIDRINEFWKKRKK